MSAYLQLADCERDGRVSVGDVDVGVGAGSWMTPNQFQHASGRGTARDWKRSIKHHGTSLKSLISSHVLTVDPPHCRCAACSTGTTVCPVLRSLQFRYRSC